jgi:squalene-hopene/tetraprenyl-beta-curcumene cyclase
MQQRSNPKVEPRPEPTAAASAEGPDLSRLGSAIDGSRDFLCSLQQEDGHWCAELEGDTILESEYIMLMHYIGRTEDAKVRKAANYIRMRQDEGGGWSGYPGGPPDVSASVKNYFVLKLTGDDPEAVHMRRAAEVIRRHGGIEACNSFTKAYLSIFQQYPWERCPAVPPEIILLPTWFYFNVYEMSSWSRAIFVPLSIIWAHKPVGSVPEHAGIAELFVDLAPAAGPAPDRSNSERIWRTFFYTVDRSVKFAEDLRLRPLRKVALERAKAWITDRLEHSDGLGAIFPPIVNSIYAFHCLGHDLDDPLILRQLGEIEKLEIEEDDTLRLQPCFSPVWDTVLTMNAMLAAEVPGDDPDLLEAAEWVLDKEVRQLGDWQFKMQGVEPGGWYFEYANEFYPDCDDTAEALIALSKIRFPDADLDKRREAALARALKWQAGMQNRNGGWAAFDKDCDKDFLQYVPFADHNAMLDPSTVDITSRSLVALSRHGYERADPAIQRGVDFIYQHQEADGCWYGRWGCNYLYGTWLALWALSHVGESPNDSRIRRGVEWIVGRQNTDGGWGETMASYEDPSFKGSGLSTASQTAWALLGLLAAGDTSDSVHRGVEYLLHTQHADGSWRDEYWTGTGFPKVFYLRYHLYATYFPLAALGTYRRLMRKRKQETRHSFLGDPE